MLREKSSRVIRLDISLGTPAGGFMASEFPIMLFGLPAAALAMILKAESAERPLPGS